MKRFAIVLLAAFSLMSSVIAQPVPAQSCPAGTTRIGFACMAKSGQQVLPYRLGGCPTGFARSDKLCVSAGYYVAYERTEYTPCVKQYQSSGAYCVRKVK